MLDSISDIAQSARHCRSDGQTRTFQLLAEELGALCSPRRVSELLSKDHENGRLSRQERHRAVRLLQKAAVAAVKGNADRCLTLRRLALEAVSGDVDEISALVEEHRLSFRVVKPLEAIQPRARASFVR